MATKRERVCFLVFNNNRNLPLNLSITTSMATDFTYLQKPVEYYVYSIAFLKGSFTKVHKSIKHLLLTWLLSFCYITPMVHHGAQWLMFEIHSILMWKGFLLILCWGMMDMPTMNPVEHVFHKGWHIGAASYVLPHSCCNYPQLIHILNRSRIIFGHLPMWPSPI